MMKNSLSILILFLVFPFMLFAQRNDGAVIAGDFADPSIIKVGKEYYAVGTSSEWAPHFPIYKSLDLKTWKQTGYVFDKTPEWISGSFWAPEYYKIKDTYYIYYTARRKSDNTSYIGVATSKYPDKGFVDHGVIIAFGSEAIDAYVFNDKGQMYITFKAYGLDKRPIELLGCKLSADGLKTEGGMFSLLKDENGSGLEGQSILKRDNYYYLFYSAGNCCGIDCSYNVRVARAKNITGPYETYEGNPILSENNKWKCMGHGTFVEGPNGQEFYLHHAYNKETTVFTGRQALISELVWPKKGDWPKFKPQEISSDISSNIYDNFATSKIKEYWQWDFRHSTPTIKQQKGILYLTGTAKSDNATGIVLTTRPASATFEMEVTVLNTNKALKGLTFYGDSNAAIGLGTQNNEIVIWQVQDNKFSILSKANLEGNNPVRLRLKVNKDRRFEFSYKQGEGAWELLVAEGSGDTNRLSQWDRSPRLGLHFKGDQSLNAQFANFSVVY